ncbi:hypothetical protein EUTSA_v10026093mg [Eutrema salsugineum]|uniref:Uncharacterized protein n=1 Tax=Eutrema salsugineum TaxID=72664 RepID=V4MIZ6_EUTSA|nr:hypothetical protein EUTSA_v10026093mg [Eutrema salsugineum]
MGFAVCVGNSPLVSMELRWVRRSKCDNNDTPRRKLNELKHAASALPRSIPIYISTLKKDINLEELRHLYTHCNHSCNRLSENGSIVENTVDMKKLRRAISRSDVVVSVFCKPHHADLVEESTRENGGAAVLYSEEESLSSSSLGDLFQDVLPLTPANGQLVGFGRAYSDYGLTASIHDLMCLPGFTFTTEDGNR